MYQQSYADLLGEDPHEAREREREAFDHAILLLTSAEQGGTGSSEAREALFFLERFWSILMDDLASQESELPERLRASLISIGIWILKEADRIRQGIIGTFTGLIEINTIIRDGLR